ncbi:MAG: DUF58 domain-containing protein [Chloroflexi bacterium]|nr:DUF58 domain-containing protein [Chloroflexota bacterium]
MSPRPKIELRARLPFVWLGLLLAGALLLPDRVWNTLLVGMGGLVLVAYLWAWELARGLSGRRELRFGWVSVGDRLSEQFEIGNDSQLPALWVEVIDHSNVPGYRAAVVRSVGGQATERWRQSAVCQRRGQFHLGPWALHTTDPFGLFRVTIAYPATTDIIIHPPIHTAIPIPLPAGQSSGRVRAKERSWQATLNAASVRDYQPQDPVRWIHWPTSARRSELFVREFDLDAAGDLWLMLDLQAEAQLGQGVEGTEEHAVLLAAALSAQALRQSRAVGLAGYGREPQLIPPGRGRGQQWRLLRALATATADGENDLATALRDLGRVAGRGSAAMIITPNGRTDWLPDLLHLGQCGVQCSVVLLDRPSFGGREKSAGLRDAVRQLGFDSYVVRQGELGQPLTGEEEQRHGYWQFKVTGTGKVITVHSPFD